VGLEEVGSDDAASWRGTVVGVTFLGKGEEWEQELVWVMPFMGSPSTVAAVKAATVTPDRGVAPEVEGGYFGIRNEPSALGYPRAYFMREDETGLGPRASVRGNTPDGGVFRGGVRRRTRRKRSKRRTRRRLRRKKRHRRRTRGGCFTCSLG